MRAHVLLPVLLALASASVFAQDLAREQLDGRKNQKIERIRIEDGGNRIDELRVGGETQSITVQPKAAVPAYEIQPTDMARSRPADARDGLSSATGKRVWNVLAF
ncbi:hypothetical protein [Ramlibacter sp.]|uniref:hypothetical protein n=1 Tax=Ramlibacter sp. TaxID=1917967 RepID=UPI001837959F|nr:hypothetical protein [Ramlibacter sp.]MBA2674441.1 hypothetical protein [Ramlibacter sp.]